MRKNKFLTFLFSTIPGCGHMYLGYMKRGVEFMAMFASSVYFAVVFIGYLSLNIEFIGAIFVVLLPVIWLYQMFDSMHTISFMRKMEIEFPEDDGFFIPGFANITNLNSLNFFKKRKVVKIIAGILIFVGAYALLSNISRVVYMRFHINGAEYYIDEAYRIIFSVIMSYVPSVAVSIVLIVAGIKLLAGKKNKNDNDNMNGGE